MAFPSRQAYERLIYSLPDTHPEIHSSTLHLYSSSPTICFVRGSVWPRNGLELRVFEYVDFSDTELLNYSYTVFRGQERVRWYDPQPHPESADLALTFPHHRHDPPDAWAGSAQSIKHNRHPGPGISFHAPNLPTLIADCILLGEYVDE